MLDSAQEGVRSGAQSGPLIKPEASATCFSARSHLRAFSRSLLCFLSADSHNPPAMSSPAAATAAPRETRHGLKLRHKAELKLLLSAPAKGIGAKKAQKDAATALEAKQAKEMEEFDAREKAEKEKEEAGDASDPAVSTAAADDDELSANAASPVAAAATPAAASSSKQPSRAQKKKAKSAAKDAARMAELRAESSGMTDFRGQENKAIQARLQPIHQRVKEMVSDGHCLYRAVYDQLRELHLDAQTKLNDNAHPFMAVRQLCAEYMRHHRDEFAPFMLSDADMPLTDAEWEAYLRDLVDEQKAVWGGHTEVVALSKMLKRKIEIYSAEAKMDVGEEFAPAASSASVDAASAGVASMALSSPSPSPSPAPPSVPLRISFHKHYFGLGNHYNSVVHDEEEEEEEAQDPAAAKA